MKILMHETRPRWYGLSWSEASPVPEIIIRIHRHFALEGFRPIAVNAPLVAGAIQKLKLRGSFTGDLEGEYFGFDCSLIRRSDEKDCTVFAAPLHQVRKPTGRRCTDCRGTGRDRSLRGLKCYHCNGTKKEHEHDWHASQALAASLAILFMNMEYYDGDTPAIEPQLMLVHMGAYLDHSPIGGMYSIELANWLRGQWRQPSTSLPSMSMAMLNAYSYMMGESRAADHRFRASIDSSNGWLNTDVPGDACGIHPSNTPRPGEGYEFGDHNTDHPAQQLALLVGLAHLHDLVERGLSRSRSSTG